MSPWGSGVEAIEVEAALVLHLLRRGVAVPCAMPCRVAGRCAMRQLRGTKMAPPSSSSWLHLTRADPLALPRILRRGAGFIGAWVIQRLVYSGCQRVFVGPLPCLVLAPGSFQVPAGVCRYPSGAACQMPPLPYSPYSSSSIPPPGARPVRPIAAAPTYGSARGTPPVAIKEAFQAVSMVAVWNLSDDTTQESLQDEIADIDFTADGIVTCPGMQGAFLLWFKNKYLANGFVACFDGTEELKHNGTKVRAAHLRKEIRNAVGVPEQISTFATYAPPWLCPSSTVTEGP